MANPMCLDDTPVTHHPDLGLWIKHEEMCCPGGPNFSKTRGVYAHIVKRPERVIGVLDTHHSQGGWAVARACQLLGKHCVNYYPVRKSETFNALRSQQQESQRLGTALVPLQAGRSAVLYHRAKRDLHDQTGLSEDYMMPNALKLPEMVEETAAEVVRTLASATWIMPGTIVISASSGTIAAGVIRGFLDARYLGLRFVIHLGYSRPSKAVWSYVAKMVGKGDGWTSAFLTDLVDEGYAYGDRARPCGVTPPCPMNEFYDLKLFSWWVREGRQKYGEALMWNIG